MVQKRDATSKVRKHQQKPAVGSTPKVARKMDAIPAASKAAVARHAEAARCTGKSMKPTTKGRRRRATIDGPCDLGRLQRAFNLSADRKVAADMERSACSLDAAGNSPKRPAIGGRPRRGTVDGPRPTEKAAATSKTAGPKFVPPLRNYDNEDAIDRKASERTYLTSSPLKSRPIGLGEYAHAPPPPRRVTIGDPLSSAQVESLRNDRFKAAATCKTAGPKFVPPLRNYDNEEAIDRKASERTYLISSSLKSPSIGLGEYARVPPPPRRVTIGDLLSLEALDLSTSEHTRFSPSLEPLSIGSGESARTPLPPRRVTIGDPFSSAQLESLRNDHYKAVAATSKKAGPKFVPPLRNYDNEEAQVGLLVRAENTLHESESSLDSLSNMTVISNGSSFDDKEASFQSPLCVSDFERRNKTHQSLSKSKISNSKNVRRATGKTSSIGSDTIPVSTSKKLSTMRFDQPKARPYRPNRHATNRGTTPHSRGRNGRREGDNNGPPDRRADYVKRLLKDHNKKLDALMA